ncbi:MAG: glycosyltransferase family 39 protein [Planctomycetota bacterium]
MTEPHLDHAPQTQTQGWINAAVGLIAAVTIARLVYVLALCPYVLAEDEAHYWEWARALDWSYYSKGPGVAWSIWAAITLLGESEGAIRTPAVLSGAVLAGAVAALARRVYRGTPGVGRITFLAAAITLLTPAFQMPAIVMTIDGPYIACWAAAALALLLATDPADAASESGGRSPRRRVWPWALFAACLGLGFLYKYTILLMLPGALGFLLLTKGRFARPPAAAWLAMGAIAALAVAPVIIWNANNGWVTIKHLAGHLGLAWGDQPLDPSDTGWSYNPGWTLELIGTQLGIAGLTIALGVVGILRARSTTDPATRTAESLMVWIAVPILVFYLLVTLVTDAEANWPIAGYLTLVPLAARAVAELGRRGAAGHSPRPKLTRRLWRAAIIMGVFSGLVMLRLDWLAAGVRSLGFEGVSAGRVLSGRELTEDIRSLQAELAAETRQDPMIIGRHYGRSSLLSYYSPREPDGSRAIVYTAARFTGGRKSQADFWPTHDLTDHEGKLGRPAVLLSGTLDHWQPVFDRVVQIPNVASDHKGEDRTLFLGYGYRGFEPPTRTEDAP